MSDELSNFKDEVTNSVKKLGEAPAIKSAFEAASTGLKIAGGALLVGLLWKPALLVAFGAAAYAGVKGFQAYNEAKAGGPTPPSL